MISDTDPKVEALQFALFRQASPERLFALICSYSRTIMTLHRQSLRREHPDLSETDFALLWVAQVYGSDLAQRVRTYLAERQSLSSP